MIRIFYSLLQTIQYPWNVSSANAVTLSKNTRICMGGRYSPHHQWRTVYDEISQLYDITVFDVYPNEILCWIINNPRLHSCQLIFQMHFFKTVFFNVSMRADIHSDNGRQAFIWIPIVFSSKSFSILHQRNERGLWFSIYLICIYGVQYKKCFMRSFSSSVEYIWMQKLVKKLPKARCKWKRNIQQVFFPKQTMLCKCTIHSIEVLVTKSS